MKFGATHDTVGFPLFDFKEFHLANPKIKAARMANSKLAYNSVAVLCHAVLHL